MALMFGLQNKPNGIPKNHSLDLGPLSTESTRPNEGGSVPVHSEKQKEFRKSDFTSTVHMTFQNAKQLFCTCPLELTLLKRKRKERMVLFSGLPGENSQHRNKIPDRSDQNKDEQVPIMFL